MHPTTRSGSRIVRNAGVQIRVVAVVKPARLLTADHTRDKAKYERASV